MGNNKYQMSLDFLATFAKAMFINANDEEGIEHCNTSRFDLQELVDRNKPIKPLFKEKHTISGFTTEPTTYRGLCGKCGEIILSRQAYCPVCGYRIGWEEDE